MAGVRDPAFWKRFSTAVHLDEEIGTSSADFKHSDTWLGRQQAKASRRSCLCWIFWLGFFAFVAGFVVTIIVLLQRGIL